MIKVNGEHCMSRDLCTKTAALGLPSSLLIFRNRRVPQVSSITFAHTNSFSIVLLDLIFLYLNEYSISFPNVPTRNIKILDSLNFLGTFEWSMSRKEKLLKSFYSKTKPSLVWVFTALMIISVDCHDT